MKEEGSSSELRPLRGGAVLEALSPTQSHEGIGASTYEFWSTEIQSTAGSVVLGSLLSSPFLPTKVLWRNQLIV